jgi:GNAT superfamily N-acetyltransferase/O-antigen ligase
MIRTLVTFKPLDMSEPDRRSARGRFRNTWTYPVKRRRSSSAAQPGPLDRIVLAEIAICALPALASVFWGQPAAAGAWLFVVLSVFVFHQVMMGRIAGFGALVVGLTPVLMLLRGEFYYHMPIALLAAFVICWFISARKNASHLWANVQLRLMILFTVTYWLVSFSLTGDYSSNLRALELSLSVCAIWLLGSSRRYLFTALVGIFLSALAICIAMMPFGERLGMASVGGYGLGNPISLGIPLALAVTLSTADGGKWLALERRAGLRAAVGLTSAALLLMTTSRGAIAVMLGILTVLVLAGGRQRRLAVAFIALFTLAVPILLASSRGQYLDQWYMRTTSSERTWSQVSSGRSDQWLLFPRLFRESPIWGFGPGLGRTQYAQYSDLNEGVTYRPGKQAEWHSLYLQLGVETGLIGLISVTCFVVALLVTTVEHFRRTKEIVPFLGLAGFLIVALSVSGMDAISGVFLGLAFLGTSPRVGRKTVTQNLAERIVPLTRPRVRRNLYSLMAVDAETIGEPWGPEQWLKNKPEKWELSRVMLRGQEPIGFIVVSLKGDAIHIHRLAVRDLYRGQGRGTDLLREVARIASQRSISTLTLKVSKENEQALRFYQRLGFSHSGADDRNVELATSVTVLLAGIQT